MRSTLRLNAKAFPFIGFFALVMQIVEPSRVWVILTMSIGGITAFCYWWARGLQRSLTFEREMRFGWAQVGDRLEERFTLVNDFVLPAAWITIRDHSTLPDHHASLGTGVDGNSANQWKVSTQCTRRGVYTLGGTTLETGDPFGIFTVTFEDPTCSTLAVMPPVIALPELRILSSGWSGEGRKRNLRSFDETINASHIREMSPNDPMRLIHWKSTAHRDKFLVHQFEGNPAGTCWVILDIDQQTQLGAGWDSTEEHGVILAASLAAQALQKDQMVGLAVNASDGSWLEPRRNEYQQRALLKLLAIAAPSDLGLKEYLQRIGQTIRQRCSLLIVTANPDPAWTESLMPLMWRGISPTVFFLDPNSFGGSAALAPLLQSLQFMSVPCHVIPRQMLEQHGIRPGHEGEWEWRVSGTGKAVAVRMPAADWRRLE